MNNKEEIVKRLDKIRTEMMGMRQEAKDRGLEGINATSILRLWAHLYQIEESLTTISWALMREIDPHAG